MVHQNNVNNNNYAAPGSPAGRPRISTGLVCPGAPVKKRLDSPSRVARGDDYLMAYFANNQGPPSPQRPQPNVVQQQPQRAAVGPRRQLFPVAVDDDAADNQPRLDFGDDMPQQRRRLFVDDEPQQRQQERPVVVSPEREDRSSD